MSNARTRPEGGWLAGYQRLLTWLEQHGRSARDSITALAREPLSTLLSAAVLAVALSLPATLYLLLDGLEHGTAGWDRGTGLTVFLKPHVTDDLARRIAGELRERDDVDAVDYQSPDDALDEFRATAEFATAIDELASNPLPGVLLITPSGGDLAALLERLDAMETIDLVSHDQQWLRRLGALTDLGRRLVMVLALLLAVGILLVVANVTHTAIAERRRAIEVMALVGATDGFIRRPFLYTGLGLGLCGGLLATLIVVLLMAAMSGPVATLSGLYDSDFALAGPSAVQVLGLVASSALLGWAGAWLGVTRHLKVHAGGR